ncbi:MAG: hypothetical protein AAGF85_08020 [Bacteroidota bacterium]
MIIGIGGCSQSGKSTLAQKLTDNLPGAHLFSLDDYTFPNNYLPLVRDRFDWEIPEAYDFDRLISEIHESQSKGQAYIIVEGILIFYDPRLVNLFDRRLFIQIDRQTFYKRRNKERRWGIEPQWFVDYIWNSFLKYGLPADLDNYKILNGEVPIESEHLSREIINHS